MSDDPIDQPTVTRADIKKAIRDALRAVAEYVFKHFEGSGRFEFADGLVLEVVSTK